MRTLGIEREWFIMRNGNIVPDIGKLLPRLQNEAKGQGLSESQFGFELFAGQVEDRTRPVISLEHLMFSLRENESLLKKIGEKLNLHFICKDFVTEKELGELVVNPFDERHQKIWVEIPRERKVAASQVAATHVHVSVTGKEAVKILNYCRKAIIDELARLGDFSQGKRLVAYQVMAETYESPVFKTLNELMAYIKEKGGERDVWDMVRYKPSTGTIEFRMFGATEDENKVREFVQACQQVVERACQ